MCRIVATIEQHEWSYAYTGNTDVICVEGVVTVHLVTGDIHAISDRPSSCAKAIEAALRQALPLP